MLTVYRSEWPVEFLLDEVWLHIRRQLVASLEEAEIWPDIHSYKRFLNIQRSRGVTLRDNVLQAALIDGDKRWLVSPTIFAASNRRFRSRTPMSLAFGYSLSEGLQSLRSNCCFKTTAETSALFNFGISIFDLLHDSQPQLVPAFTSHFDSEILLRLHNDHTFPHTLYKSAAECDEPEIRLLLQVISLVYQKIYLLVNNERNDAIEQLLTLLASAYAAELKSASITTSGDRKELTEISKQKSSLPFSIINAINQLPYGTSNASETENEVADELGKIFWVLDDLVDVIGDLRSGSINSLIIQASGGQPTDMGTTLTYILENEIIDESVVKIKNALLSAQQQIQSCALDDEWTFDRVLASYVRMWIE